MAFEWTPVSKGLPNKTKEATEADYLVTAVSDNGTRYVFVTNWGPVDPTRLELFKDSSVYKDYIFDGWAFGDLWSSGIDTVEIVIAWSRMPEPYMEGKENGYRRS